MTTPEKPLSEYFPPENPDADDTLENYVKRTTSDNAIHRTTESSGLASVTDLFMISHITRPSDARNTVFPSHLNRTPVLSDYLYGLTVIHRANTIAVRVDNSRAVLCRASGGGFGQRRVFWDILRWPLKSVLITTRVYNRTQRVINRTDH